MIASLVLAGASQLALEGRPLNVDTNIAVQAADEPDKQDVTLPGPYSSRRKIRFVKKHWTIV